MIAETAVTIIRFLLVLSFLIFVHELGHFLAAKLSGVWVKQFSLGFPPHLFTKKIGETEYKLGLIPMGGYVSLYGEDAKSASEEENVPKNRSFGAQPAWKRLVILSSGVLMNVATAYVIIMIVLGMSGKQELHTGLALEEVFDGGPAQQAEIANGTVITKYKDTLSTTFTPVTDLETFISFIQGKLDEQVIIEVVDALPNENPRQLTITPTDYYGEGTGSLGVRIGVSIVPTYTKIPWYQIPYEGIRELGYLTGLMVDGLADLGSKLLRGEVPQDVAGPVGLAVVSADVAKQGFMALLQFVALISLNLALVNFLPFPALDGGRVFFVVLEILVGKSLDNKYQYWAHLAGFAVLIGLFVLVTVYDVIRFF